TLADVVPLVGEYRVIAKIGLDRLSRGPHKIGLRSLLDISGLTGKTIDSYHISFLLAPRVNAAGRMSTPDIATRLLLASDEAMSEEVRALALQLDGENVRRQEAEAQILAAAKKIVTTDPDIGAPSMLVVPGRGCGSMASCRSARSPAMSPQASPRWRHVAPATRGPCLRRAASKSSMVRES